MQHLADVSALGRAGIELSVTERPGASFSVTIVRIRVYDAFQGQLGHIHLAAFHILSALQHNGLQSQLEQLQGGEHPGRAGTNHQHRSGLGDIPVGRYPVRLKRLAFPVRLHAVAVQDILPGIYAAAHHFHVTHLFGLHTQCLGGRLTQLSLGEFFAYFFCQFKLFHLHISFESAQVTDKT